MALVAFSGQIVTGGTVLLGLVAVILRSAAVEPIPAHGVRLDFVAIMAAGGVIAVGSIQGVALLTGGVPAFIRFVFAIVPVQPPGTDRRPAALGIEVALIAIRRQIMAGGAVLLGLVAVKLSIVFVKPRPACHVFLDFVAVMAAGRVVAVGTVQGVTLLAGGVPISIRFMFNIVPVQPH